jgi:flagellar basal body-associated protein FliL
VYDRLAVILPSVILSIIILILLTVLIVLVFLRFPRHKLRKINNSEAKAKAVPKVYESELQFVRENLKKVNRPISATNPLSLSDSAAHQLDVE